MCEPIRCPLSQIVALLLIDSKRTIHSSEEEDGGSRKSFRYHVTAASYEAAVVCPAFQALGTVTAVHGLVECESWKRWRRPTPSSGRRNQVPPSR